MTDPAPKGDSQEKPKIKIQDLKPRKDPKGGYDDPNGGSPPPDSPPGGSNDPYSYP